MTEASFLEAAQDSELDGAISDEILNWVLSQLSAKASESNLDLLRRVVRLGIQLNLLHSIHLRTDRSQALQDMLETVALGHTRGANTPL